MRPQLVFWRKVPHDVDLGYINYVAEHWGADITIVCEQERDKRLVSLDFGDVDSKNVTTVILKNKKNKEDAVCDVINNTKGAIHIFSGLRGWSKAHLDTYLDLEQNPKVVINAEIPTFKGHFVERVFRRFVLNQIYKRLRNKYNSVINCFLTLGEKGKNVYIRYGFDKNVIYPFMYCPKMPETENTHQVDEVKFMYVGRLDDRNKGVDSLMEAVDMLSKTSVDNWSLDVVGGYGDIKQEVFDWAEKHERVNCVGTVAFTDICNDMCDYDVCIVPSHYDGWNMTPNMAINAGCATIITNKATSDELIKESDSGVVIQDKSKELFLKMKEMCDNTSVITQYKENTQNYKKKISGETVGQYFIDILDYTFNLNDTKKPKCPWL